MESSAAKSVLLKKSPLFKVAFGLALLLGVAPYSSAANRLIDVKYHSIVDHQLELQLVFEEAVKEPEINLNASPAQIILGFDDSLSGLEKDVLPINNVGVKSMSTLQDSEQLKVLVDLAKVKAYQGKVMGNTYRLTINDEVRSEERR